MLANRSLVSARLVIISAHSILLIFLSLLIISYNALDGNPEKLVYPICVFLVVIFLWSVWSWKKLAGTLFDPYIIFLSAAMLFNAGRAILEIFYLNKHGVEKFTDYSGVVIFSFPTQTILKTLLLVSLGLTSFHLGALFIAARKKKQKDTDPQTRYQQTRLLRLVGWGFLGLSLIPSMIVLEEYIRIISISGYFGLFQRQAPTGFEATPRVLMSFLVPGALFLLAGSKKHPVSRAISALIIIIYAGLLLGIGSRLWGGMILVAYAWLWHRCIRPLPKMALISAAGFMLFIVFPLIPIIRNVPRGEGISAWDIIRSYFSIDNPIIAIIYETGSSMMTIAHTLELVPIIRAFDYGVGYLYALLTIVPNLFWNIHPTISHGLYAYWLVSTVSPSTAALGGGYGFSFIAEAYANFGWVGTPMLLVIFGSLFARFVLWAQNSGNPVKLATVASFLAFFLIYARGESGLVARSLFWYALLPYFLINLIFYFLKSVHEPRCYH